MQMQGMDQSSFFQDCIDCEAINVTSTGPYLNKTFQHWKNSWSQVHSDRGNQIACEYQLDLHNQKHLQHTKSVSHQHPWVIESGEGYINIDRGSFLLLLILLSSSSSLSNLSQRMGFTKRTEPAQGCSPTNTIGNTQLYVVQNRTSS